MEPGFIRKPREAEHSWRTVKEALKPLALENLFLLFLFQQLVERGHSACP
jgi:hypothetical protein